MINRHKTSLKELTIDALRAQAPSIFSEQGSERVSDKYKHISTFQVIEALQAEGFNPVFATQSRCRLENKKDFTKHLLRFRRNGVNPEVGGLFPEVVLINSHDGSSSYKLMAGVYRLVCSNGMIAGHTYQETKVRHQGDIIGHVIEGTYSVIKDSQKMIESSKDMSNIILSQEEKRFFAQAVHEVRFDDEENGKGFEADKFLRPRRAEEVGKNDLFTLFNVAQENVIRGGVKGYRLNDLGKRVGLANTREVRSIDKNTALNRALWTLAEKMADLKRA